MHPEDGILRGQADLDFFGCAGSHNTKPPIFAALVMVTKAMTQQPYSDCWTCVGINPLILFQAREVALGAKTSHKEVGIDPNQLFMDLKGE